MRDPAEASSLPGRADDREKQMEGVAGDEFMSGYSEKHARMKNIKEFAGFLPVLVSNPFMNNRISSAQKVQKGM
ncbi:MAG: hypothetical protein LBK99_08835 [Opitutaceae bacterium]|nr:hypothetical protein [Opitutaceae bacterium]